MTDFDIAVSFAGEDRDYVATIVEKLKARGASVFYDLDHVSEMWGEDLVDFLQGVYGRRAKFAIIFVSRHYIEKVWTRHERRSVQDRALQQSSPYLLPVRLDDTELPGLHSTVGHLDARTIGVDGIVEAAMRKLGGDRSEAIPRFNGRTPRTSEEIAVLLAERPRGWEYLLYAGVIKQGIAGLEEKYRDHLLEYARRNGKYLAIEDTAANMSRNFTMLDWSADIRGTGAASDAIRRVLDVEARWTKSCRTNSGPDMTNGASTRT